MTPEEFELYKKFITTVPEEQYVHASDYPLGGTLLYGYTLERQTFHVYVYNEKVVRVIYDSIPHVKVHDLVRDDKLPVDMLIPTKRAYPERTLLTFAMDIWSKDYTIPFTTMTDGVRPLVPGDFVALVV